MWRESKFTLKTRGHCPYNPYFSLFRAGYVKNWTIFWKPSHIHTFMKPNFQVGNGPCWSPKTWARQASVIKISLSLRRLRFFFISNLLICWQVICLFPRNTLTFPCTESKTPNWILSSSSLALTSTHLFDKHWSKSVTFISDMKLMIKSIIAEKPAFELKIQLVYHRFMTSNCRKMGNVESGHWWLLHNNCHKCHWMLLL